MFARMQNFCMFAKQFNTKKMTTLEKFRKADAKVTLIEDQQGGTFEKANYGGVGHTEEYNNALLEAQDLYAELETLGINPF